AEYANNDLLFKIEEIIYNYLPIEEIAIVIDVLINYSIYKRISNNNYYSRNCNIFKIIATLKGANLRKGINNTIIESGIKPLNYIIVKAIYFIILALNYNMIE
ncbi:hypothetical protein OFM35_27360, partial [Escherichia coli]|nr:hypothetical protein [Escherichia coli]